jgi:hypothetical protein
MKGALLTVTVMTITKSALSQVSYSLTILIVNTVVNVSMSKIAFESSRIFFISQGGLLVVALSIGLLGYYIFYQPGEVASEYVIIFIFILLNAIYILLVAFLMFTKLGTQWFAVNTVSRADVVTSEPSNENQDSKIEPPPNSIVSPQSSLAIKRDL